MGKELIVHYYPSSNWFNNSVCGIYCEDIGDMSNNIKWVTCKKCLKLYNNGKNTITSKD